MAKSGTLRQKRKMIESETLTEELDARLRNQQTSVRDDMKTYIKLHYELKEDLMDFFLRWL